MPEHNEVRQFYDEQYYARLSHAGSRAALPWHMRTVASRLEPLKGQTVLDIACGQGGWLAELHRRGMAVSGIDISHRAVESARRLLPEADIREGVAEALPFEDHAFDLVTCMGSLEHFIDQPLALREMRRVAKHKGRYLILVPNAGFLTRRLKLFGGTGQVAIRETVRSIEKWTSMFEGAGMEVVDKWRDLHPLAADWICRGPWWKWPIRAAQALMLCAWPVAWQYQVYFLCRDRDV